jgi:hypothetical protein
VGEAISAGLDHARRGVTAVHYDHYDRAREKRAAVALWSDQIERLTGEICGPVQSKRVTNMNQILRDRSATSEAATASS